jgi:hypothetical protein
VKEEAEEAVADSVGLPHQVQHRVHLLLSQLHEEGRLAVEPLRGQDHLN